MQQTYSTQSYSNNSMSDTDGQQIDPRKNPAEFVADAAQKIMDWSTWYTPNIALAQTMRTFTYVDQWESYVRQQRIANNRPTLQINMVQELVRTILSEFKEAAPALEIFPRSKYAKQERVDIYQGLVNQICYESDAQQVYQTAFKDAIDCGYGAMMAVTEYESPTSFNLVIRLKAISDVLNCSWDPGAESQFKTDGDFCSVQCLFSKKEFMRRWPQANVKSATPLNYMGAGNSQRQYFADTDSCYITHYFYKVYKKETLFKLRQGTKIIEITKSDYKKYTKNQKRRRKNAQSKRWMIPEAMYQKMMDDSEIGEVIDSRETTTFKIRHCIITSQEVLEENDFPGQLLPIVYMDGFSTIVNGNQTTVPFNVCTTDAQRMVNFSASTMADAMLMSRKEQYMVATDMIKTAGVIEMWKNPGNVQGALQYDRSEAEPMDKPVPITATPVNSEYGQIMSMFANMVDETSGRGQDVATLQRAAVSGVGIMKAQMKENLSRGIYADNAKKTIAELGRVMVGMIPKTYDTEREVTIMGRMNQPKTITINKQMPSYSDEESDYEPYEYYQDEDDRYGVENDVVNGHYSVGVTTGSSFAANREMQMAQVNELMKMSESPIFPLVADVLTSLLDIKDVPLLYKRIRENVVPPNIIAQEEHKPPPPPPPKSPEQKLAEAKMAIGLISDMANAKADIYKAKSEMKQTDLDALNSLVGLIEQIQKTQASAASADAEAIKALAADNTQQIQATAKVMEMTNSMMQQNQQHDVDQFEEIARDLFRPKSERKRAPENAR